MPDPVAILRAGHLPQLRRLAEELGLEDAVQFVGAVQPGEVAHWLSAADVFCLVSAREGCCNAVLEALASGRPVVATPVGDNTHYVADGVNGRIVPVDDSTATSRALADVLSERHWDAEQISRGLPVGDWDHVGRRVIEFFSQRLAGRADTSTRRAPATL